MHSSDLSLLQIAAHFDLRDKHERRRSAKLLRQLTIRLHEHIGAQATFEIGACEASFSIDVRGHAPDARIYAFEANPRNYEHFSAQKVFAERGIHYLHRAITNRSGSAEFYVQSKEGVAKRDSLLRRTLEGNRTAITVPASSLSDFIEAEELVGAVSTAWIDVEGAIQNVLTGLGERIDQFHLIHCETEDVEFWKGQWRAGEVFSYLAERGFVPVARDFEYPNQYNVLFLRPAILKLPGARAEIADYYSGLGRQQSRFRWRRLLDFSKRASH